jgi:DNA-binding PadR family transcriptional regulator
MNAEERGPTRGRCSVNKTTYLGELEQMILLAILRLGDDAYGMSIRDELERRAGRSVTRSAAYITLERLAKKGYVTTRMGDPTPERGGRAKRYYEISDAGREALRESGRAFMNLWAGQESLLEEA